MIRHSVYFRLHHVENSAEEAKFLTDALVLTSIPGVENFQISREVSPKNDYRFGFAMDFADAEVYEAYNIHPAHQSFVADRWMPEVAEFIEIDTVPHG